MPIDYIPDSCSVDLSADIFSRDHDTDLDSNSTRSQSLPDLNFCTPLPLERKYTNKGNIATNAILKECLKVHTKTHAILESISQRVTNIESVILSKYDQPTTILSSKEQNDIIHKETSEKFFDTLTIELKLMSSTITDNVQSTLQEVSRKLISNPNDCTSTNDRRNRQNS